MTNFDYRQLDIIIHSRIRLAIISVLITVDTATFQFIKQNVKTTDGNLSIHLKKLEEAKYLSVKKLFVDRKPQSQYKLTSKGEKAFSEYIDHLEKIIQKRTRSN